MGRLGVLGAGLLLVLSGCTGDPAPYETARSQALPTVILSADNPEARISFGVEAEGTIGNLVTQISWQTPSGFDGSASVEVRYPEDAPGELADGRYECAGSSCLGHYEVIARWKPGGMDSVDFAADLTLSALSSPPRYAVPAAVNVTTDSDVVVLAEGYVNGDTRDWLAIRAPDGLPGDRWLVLEFDSHSHPVSIATDLTTEVLSPAAGASFPVAMPATCSGGPCGLALTIEMINNDRGRSGSAEWRLVDYGHSDQPLHIEQRSERTPRVEGWGGAFLGDFYPGERRSATATVVAPAFLMEGADPLRPVRVEIRFQRESHDVAWWFLDAAGERTDRLVHFCDGISLCELTFGVEAINNSATDEALPANLAFVTTTFLPHLVEAPNIRPIAEVTQ